MRWLTLPIGGQKWVTELVRDKHPELEGGKLFGVTLPDKCKVYIAKGFQESTRESAAIHENFGHAAFYVSGVSQQILELCNGDEERAEEVEEQMIRALELVWYPMFLHLGFKLPKVNQ